MAALSLPSSIFPSRFRRAGPSHKDLQLPFIPIGRSFAAGPPPPLSISIPGPPESNRSAWAAWSQQTLTESPSSCGRRRGHITGIESESRSAGPSH
jgi:hypothetical protein